MSTHTECCLLCGGELEYGERATESTCNLCGRTEQAHVRCPQGHYVCEACHGAGFLARLPGLLSASASTSPFEIAEQLLNDPELPMLGCEHAHIAAASLLQALINAGSGGVSQAHLEETLQRTARQAVSAYCGLSGVCGVVPALGAAYSVLVGAQCGRGPQTQATMELVARLAAVTAEEAEPGCCKAYLRRCLAETAAYMEETLGLSFPEPSPIACRDVERHPHGCRGPACRYHPPSKETAVSTAPAAQASYDDFFQLAYAPGVLDARTKILVSLGASLAAGCAP